ncbi:unnamed protein product [Trichogramma brassicae]|uniref:Integrase catalytic domain-containing protein n=1 Tax=Trichogramma brassicae TaxID=86971 RepID=A0A6H5IU56_9HYME|nr:unnamed protein product [Trichogramma brassicae]
MIDRYTRWSQAVPIADMSTPSVATAFYKGWISFFGTPLTITTDQGAQFDGKLLTELCKLVGAKHIHNSPYYPQSNSMVERLHRTLKAALKCSLETPWTLALPGVLIGLRTTFNKELQASPVEMVFGTSLRIPGEFMMQQETDKILPSSRRISTTETHSRSLISRRPRGRHRTRIARNTQQTQRVTFSLPAQNAQSIGRGVAVVPEISLPVTRRSRLQLGLRTSKTADRVTSSACPHLDRVPEYPVDGRRDDRSPGGRFGAYDSQTQRPMTAPPDSPQDVEILSCSADDCRSTRLVASSVCCVERLLVAVVERFLEPDASERQDARPEPPPSTITFQEYIATAKELQVHQRILLRLADRRLRSYLRAAPTPPPSPDRSAPASTLQSAAQPADTSGPPLPVCGD